MNCDTAEELFYDYLTERLGGQERKSLQGDLETCEISQLKLGIFEESISALNHWDPYKLPDNFADQVMERCFPAKESSLAKLKTAMSSLFSWKLPFQTLAAAAVAVLVMVVFTYLGTTDKGALERKVTIETGISAAPDPLILDTKDPDFSLSKFIQILENRNGFLVRRKPQEGGIEVTFRIEKSLENALIRDLSELGEIKVKKEGYLDSQGNVVLILRKP
jgi:hypothetical protein